MQRKPPLSPRTTANHAAAPSPHGPSTAQPTNAGAMRAVPALAVRRRYDRQENVLWSGRRTSAAIGGRLMDLMTCAPGGAEERPDAASALWTLVSDVPDPASMVLLVLALTAPGPAVVSQLNHERKDESCRASPGRGADPSPTQRHRRTCGGHERSHLVNATTRRHPRRWATSAACQVAGAGHP